MSSHRWRAAVAVVAIAFLVGANAPRTLGATPPRPEVTPAPHGAALPRCRHDDVTTRYDHPSEWRIALLDPILRVPADYRPPHLVPVSRAGLNGDHPVRRVMVDDLRALARAARRADAAVAVISGHRTYRLQKSLFQREVRLYGREAALRRVARPGHSEHQLGTALDFRSASSTRLPWAYDDWATTRPGRWMERHAWEYGFVMSFPKDMRDETCFRYEPWHYRYLGRGMAAAIHQSDRTLRRYLWEEFETAPG